MGRSLSILRALATSFAFVATLAYSHVVLAAASVTSTQLVSSVRSGRTTFDYTYTVTVQNGSPGLSAATASVVSNSPNTIVLKGNVALGVLAANSTTTSSDTFI